MIVLLPALSAEAAAVPSSTAEATSNVSAGRASSTSDFPDPFVLAIRGHYFAYATNVGATHVPVRTSVDLSHWLVAGDAVPTLPVWATSTDLTWAPSVLRIGSQFVMYLSVWNSRRGLHCIASASASRPVGPFTVASRPLVCGTGAIDASPFRASDGSAWLTWKFEADNGRRTRIVSRPLSRNGDKLIGKATVLITPTLAWEDGVVEGPSIIRWHSFYLLFYAASDWSSDHYATGFALCASARGPCVKARSPLLASRRNEVSPGGLSAFRVGTHLFAAFHIWRHGVGYPQGARALVIAKIRFVEGSPRLDRPGP
jgi:beta-xylosidase